MKPEAVVLVPPAVVTATSTAPADLAGVVTVIDVGVDAFTVAVTPSKVTDVGELRFVPVMVTAVPPAIGPEGGEIDEMPGTLRALACRTPAPQVLVVQSKPVPVGNVNAVDWIWERTCAGVIKGVCDLSKAATPATCGAAMLVPLYEVTVGPTGVVVPVFMVEKIPEPGAAISTVGPKFE